MSNSSTSQVIDQPSAGTQGADWRDFVALLKPRVMTLVVFTGLAGMLVAPGSIHPVIAFTAILALTIGAGAAGAINMWYDADIDARMTRTAERPIPAGKIAPGEALGFAVTLSVGSVAVMGLNVNWLAAGILAFSILFYGVFYTMWLKRHTPQNIVIGGAAGAFPPVIGWAAVTGDVTLMPLLLFGIIFLWTPPHFWALALVKSGEYAKVGVPMMPVVAGAKATKRQIVAYTVALIAVSLAPWALGYAGVIYGATAAVLGAVFLAGAVQVMRKDDKTGDDKATAMRLFAFSILYLFALFTALLIDYWVLA